MKIITIRVDEDANVVSGDISDPELSREATIEIIERIEEEALRLVYARASLRRFQRPITLHFLDAPKRSPEIISARWEAEDVRGRKASVRIEIQR